VALQRGIVVDARTFEMHQRPVTQRHVILDASAIPIVVDIGAAAITPDQGPRRDCGILSANYVLRRSSFYNVHPRGLGGENDGLTGSAERNLALSVRLVSNSKTSNSKIRKSPGVGNQ